MSKKNDPKNFELKYNQLLKDHKKLAKDTLVIIRTNQIMKNLIIDLAECMELEEIGKLTPDKIIDSAKERINQ